MRPVGSKTYITSQTDGRITLLVDGQTITVQTNHAVTPPTTYVWVNKGLVAELR